MAIWLQIVLAVVLVTLGAFLVPLLLQLRRTAAAVERLAESARLDLDQIANDVHHLRARVDGLADLAAESLELPIGIGRIVTMLVKALELIVGKGAPVLLGSLLTGLRFVLNLVRRPRKEGRGQGGDR